MWGICQEERRSAEVKVCIPPFREAHESSYTLNPYTPQLAPSLEIPNCVPLSPTQVLIFLYTFVRHIIWISHLLFYQGIWLKSSSLYFHLCHSLVGSPFLHSLHPKWLDTIFWVPVTSQTWYQLLYIQRFSVSNPHNTCSYPWLSLSYSNWDLEILHFLSKVTLLTGERTESMK